MPAIKRLALALLLLLTTLPLFAQDDPTDPYIVAQATALNNNPNQIFNFVRDQIAMEIYAGSVRGARGALWTRGANSLDRASLLVALLKAAGQQARYVRGSLAYQDATSTAIIRRLFPFRSRILGCLPSVGNSEAVFGQNPEFDSRLLTDVLDYFWVEYGPSNTPLDPNLSTNTAGQALITASSRFTTVPDNLRQKITVRLKAETYPLANGLFQLGTNSATVLNRTLYVSDLVGKPLSVGQFVSATGLGALVFNSATFTYTPYLFFGQGGPDVNQDTLVTGDNFQETYTNFPVGSTVLTGVFLEIDAVDENNNPQTYTRTVYDRLGRAARSGLIPTNVSITGSPSPVLSDFDITTINVLAGLQHLPAFANQQTRLSNALAAYTAIQSLVAAVPTTGNLTPDQQNTIQQAVTFQRNIVIAQNEMTTMAFNGASDAYLVQLQKGYGVQASYNSPRLTLGVSSFADGEASFRLDVLKNNLRYAGIYGNARRFSYLADVNRGLLESHLESVILAQVTGLPATGIREVFAALGDPEKLTVISSQNLNTLDFLSISANAKAYITDAVRAGRIVLTPREMVTVNGKITVGWLETDPSGRTISVFEDGGHQAIASYAGVQVSATKYNARVAQFIGRVQGIGAAGIAFSAGILNGVATQTSYAGVLKSAKTAVAGVDTAAPDLVNTFWKKTSEALKKLKLSLPVPVEQGFSLIDSFATGLKEGLDFAQKFLQANLPVDPEVLPFLGSTLEPDIPGVAPGGSPGVQTTIANDTLFTQSVNNLDLPILFRGRITNTGPTTDTFRVRGNATQYYFISTPIDIISLAPGQVVEVSVCVRPWDPLLVAPLNTPQPVSFTVVSDANPAITSTSSATFNQPSVASLQVTIDPPVLIATPGATIPARLTIAAVGNAPTGPINLLTSLSPGLGLTGVSSPINIPQQSVTTQNLNISVPSNTPPGTTLKIGVAANFSAGGLPQSVIFNVPVTVVTAGQCALEAAVNAKSLNLNNFATLLNQLAIDMNQSIQDTSNKLAQGKVTADVISIIVNQLAAPFLTPFIAPLTTANNNVINSSPAGLSSALNALNTSLCSLRDTLFTASGFQIRSFILPANQTTGPNLPVTYTLAIFNDAPVLRTFDLSITGAPAGISTVFDFSVVTIGPNGRFFGTVTITPGASFVAPFDFNIVVTPRGAPAYAKTAPGALRVRPELLSIDNISATPTAIPPGGVLNVSARVFSAINQPRSTFLRFVLENNIGQTVTFPSQGVTVDLTTQSSLQTFTIPPFTLPSNVTPGIYTIVITGLDGGGTPIFGATGRAPLLVGTPISALLSANPSTATPGASTVQARLTLNRETIPNPVSTLLGTAALTGAPRTLAIYANGPQTLAYICADRAVNIVDVTNPASPTVLSNFAGNILGPIGYTGVGCGITGSTLVVSYSRENGNNTANLIPTNFASFNLSNPLAPTLIGQSNILRSDIFGFNVSGNTAFGANTNVFFNPFSLFIFQQTGDVVSLNLSNAPVNGQVSIASTLFSAPPNDPNLGGPRGIRGFVRVNPTRLYAASSSSEGGNIQAPGNPPIAGQLIVVDTSNPAALSLVRRVDVPQAAFLTGVAVLGNTAVAVGDSGGIYDAVSGFTGNVVIASFDITDPSNPILRNTVVTQLKSKNGAGIVPLTNNTFAVGGTEVATNSPVLVLVDAANPNALRYIPYTAAFNSTPVLSNGDLFYSLGTDSLGIFRLSTINGPQVSVTLRIPKNATTNLVPNSFNQTPTAVTPGTTFDTYRWDQPSLDTISFNMALTGMSPGDVRRIVEGGTATDGSRVTFSLPAFGPGTIALPPLTILTEQIMSITPTFVSIFAGNSANFTVTLRNPTAQSQTFSIGSFGMPASWFTLPPPITLAPGASTTFTAVFTPALNSNGSGFGRQFDFSITATALSGITAAAGATSFLQDNPNLGNDPPPFSYGLSGTVNPPTATTGRGSSAVFEISLNNTGNRSFDVLLDYGALVIPNGWGIAATNNFLTLPPGAGNARSAIVTFSIPANALIGSVPFSLPVRFGSSTTLINFTVNVVPNGVNVSLSPPSGAPGTVFQATVTNIGTVADTFTLAPVGPLAENTGVNGSSVTLNPGASSVFNVLVSNVSLNLPGNFPVQLRATSQAVPSVFKVGAATLIVPPLKGISATLSPNTQQVATTPKDVTLSLGIQATGNVNDTYSALITSTTGPLTASLTGPVAGFGLPALGSAAFPAPARLNASGTGTVTVKVTSLSDPTVSSSTTATIQTSAALLPPTVSAGPNRIVPLRRLAILDGTATVDPNTPVLPLTYAWTLTSAPANSTVTTGTLNFAAQSRASFRPDLPGAYVFRLTAANSSSSAFAEITITAQNQAPVAITRAQQFTSLNTITWLDGTDSYDPDGNRITYQWQLLSSPAGSTAVLRNAATPRAYFRPVLAGQYQFQLVASDGSLSSTPSLLTLSATVSTTSAPNASAGLDVSARTNTQVNLLGSASSALPLTYAWTFLQLPPSSTLNNASIQQATTLNARFTPDLAGDYLLRLRVSDGTNNTDSTVKVTANNFNAPPVPSATIGTFFTPNSLVATNSTASTDPDNGPGTLSVDSAFVAIPSASTAVLQAGNFTPNNAGFHVLRFAADDRLLEGFTNVFTTVASPCDANADGLISTLDLELISAALGLAAAPKDPRDGNLDAQINAADVTFCTALLPPGEQPNLVAAPTSLTFNSLVGVNPVNQQVLISSTGIPLTITAASNQPWLAVSITNGNSLTVSVNVTGLASQTYNGKVTVSSTSAGNSPLEIPVTLNLTALTPVTLATTPTGRGLTANSGPIVAPQVLNLAPGSALTLDVPTPQSITGTRFDFKSWSNGGAKSQSVNVPANPVQLTALFDISHQLTYTITGQGTVTPASGLFFLQGSQQTLNAAPGTCSLPATFAPSATISPAGTVTLSAPQNVSVTFPGNAAQPATALRLTFGGDRRITGTNRFRRAYSITNTGPTLNGVVLAVDPPFTNVASVYQPAGTTQCAAPLGSAYYNLGNIAAGATISVTIEVVTTDPARPWSVNLRPLFGNKP